MRTPVTCWLFYELGSSHLDMKFAGHDAIDTRRIRRNNETSFRNVTIMNSVTHLTLNRNRYSLNNYCLHTCADAPTRMFIVCAYTRSCVCVLCVRLCVCVVGYLRPHPGQTFFDGDKCASRLQQSSSHNQVAGRAGRLTKHSPDGAVGCLRLKNK